MPRMLRMKESTVSIPKSILPHHSFQGQHFDFDWIFARSLSSCLNFRSRTAVANSLNIIPTMWWDWQQGSDPGKVCQAFFGLPGFSSTCIRQKYSSSLEKIMCLLLPFRVIFTEFDSVEQCSEHGQVTNFVNSICDEMGTVTDLGGCASPQGEIIAENIAALAPWSSVRPWSRSLRKCTKCLYVSSLCWFFALRKGENWNHF